MPILAAETDMSVEANTVERSSMEASDIFRVKGYVVLPGMIDPALADFLWSYVHTKFASMLLTSQDRQVPHTPAAYGDPAFDGLLEYLRPQIEQRSSVALYPTYSYFRLYKRGDVLKRHRDRPACEISISLNLGQTPDDPWPIYVEKDGEPYRALLSPGDALLYRGIDCFHWREAYAGTRLVQVFLHYVDRNGPHANQKFDGRQSLMRPKQHDAADGNQSRDL